MPTAERLIATNRIKLRHLACFVEVAGQKSFGRAAQALAMTQPAISKAIAELEAELGVAVFQRSRRGVELTPYGEAFRRYAGASLAALRQGIDTVSQARRAGGPVLSIGALPTVAASVMPRAVARAKAAGLASVIRVTTGPNDYLLERLGAGTLDLVVGRLADTAAMKGLAFEHLYTEEIVFVCRPGHPLAGGAVVELPRIGDFTVLMPIAGSIIRPEVDRLLIARGVPTPADVIETVSPSFGRAYLTASDAIWIISRGVVADDLDRGILVRLPVDADSARGPVGLTMRADTPPSVAAQLAVQAIRAVVAERGEPAGR